MEKHKASKIFVPGGMPTYTYIPRTERKLEDSLRESTENLCQLTTVTGATKSGKTVLTKKVFPREKSIWVDGGTIGNEDDLWNYVLESINGYIASDKSNSKGSRVSFRVKLSKLIRFIPFFAEGKGSIGGEYAHTDVKTTKKSLTLSPRAAAITQLRKVKLPLIIDDFHYLDRSFQGDVIRALKPLIFDGLPVILIAIPHRRFDSVKVEREMTGRLQSIDVPSWNQDELIKIPMDCFPLLNSQIQGPICRKLANEAYGSPHLMQEFCRAIARTNDIQETSRTKYSIDSVSNELFSEVAEGTGKVIFEKLAKGPRQRSDRIQRTMKSQKKADIYKVVLYALAKLSPGLDTIEYEKIREAIREILQERIPQAHEVTRVLERMAQIASADEASTPVIDWEKEEQKLHITDPFFAFYLKWGVKIG